MKRIIITLCICQCMILGISSCKKEQKIENVSPEFTITKHPVVSDITEKQTAEIKISIHRASGYKGKFYIHYKQPEGQGFGTLVYEDVVLKKGVDQPVTSDNLSLKYTAITKNYHQLDFVIYNEHNKRIEFSSIFNQDKKGENDNEFTVLNQTLTNQVLADETAYINLQINRGKTYNGRYYIQYTQSSGHGLGTVSYNGSVISKGQTYPLTHDAVQLHYTAQTENYHQLNIGIFDESGLRKDLAIVFNENKKGIDDYLFSASLPALQTSIKDGESVNFQIDFKPSKAYKGKYFIKYNQIKGHGSGLLKCNQVQMEKTIPVEFTGNEIRMSYHSASEFYHQLDISIYDEQNRKVDLSVVFNEDKKGESPEGFTITWWDYNPQVADFGSLPIDFQLKRLDKEYKGKFYYRWFLNEGSIWLYEGNTKGSGTGMKTNLTYELKLNPDDTFSFFFYFPYTSAAPREMKMIFFDEDNHTFEHIFKFNESKND